MRLRLDGAGGRRRAGAPVASIADRLRASFRWLTVGITATLVLIGTLAWWLLAVCHPRVVAFTDLERETRLTHQVMLHRNNDLRDWLATGDAAYLSRSGATPDPLDVANERLTRLLGRSETTDRHIVEVRIAQQRWIDGWAAATAAMRPHELGDEVLADHLDEGSRQFERYDAASEQLVGEATRRRDQAVAEEGRMLTLGMAVGALVCASLLVVARTQRRRTEQAVVVPVTDLLETMGHVRDGDLSARPAGRGPRELRQIAAGLAEMTSSLAAQHDLALRREAEAAEHAGRLADILAMARDVAGSLVPAAVAGAVAAAAARVSGGDAVIWRRLAGDEQLVALHDTRTEGVKPSLDRIEPGAGAVGRAAETGRVVTAPTADGPTVTALPLVVAGEVSGVIEVIGGDADSPAVRQTLETLAVHAAASLEAARLHEHVEELSQRDPLTGLYNRRRLDDDLAEECERSLRYGRSLSFILLDIDQFKRLNDGLGHLYGDDVLRRVASILEQTVRSSDTVYRYGGEELAVMVPEADEVTAGDLAERLRATIERLFGVSAPDTRVTASFGVASLPSDAVTPRGLVAAADMALYASKRTGRNRVTSSGQPDASALRTAP